MSLDRDISLLSRVPLFNELNTEQLRLLAFSAVRLELKAGQVLFREETVANSGYVVAFGAVELSLGHGSKRRALTSCETGSLIGEMALFIETRRPATATAMVATELLELDRKLITRMINEYPHVAVGLRAKLASRLTATIGELARVGKVFDEIDRRGRR